MIQPLRLLLDYTRDVARARGSARKGLHFIFHSLRCPRNSLDWLAFLGPFYARFGFARPPVHMVIKLTRSYGSKHLSVAEIVCRLKTHYQLLASRFSAQTMQRLLAEEKLCVGNRQGKSGQTYSIYLQHSSAFRQEGELTLSLQDDLNQGVFQALTFSIARLKNEAPFIWIGGLQGARMTGAKEQIVKVTRDLHGLRPKTIMLESIYPMAQFIGAQEVRAIANKNHPFAGSRKVILADYDSFWEEVGGVRNADGNFLLPTELKRRTVDEVPSHKRKDWLKRQAYVSAMQLQMQAALQSFAADQPIKIRTEMLDRVVQPTKSAQPTWVGESLAYLLPKPAYSVAATLMLGLFIGIVFPNFWNLGSDGSSYEEIAE